MVKLYQDGCEATIFIQYAKMSKMFIGIVYRVRDVIDDIY